MSETRIWKGAAALAVAGLAIVLLVGQGQPGDEDFDWRELADVVLDELVDSSLVDAVVDPAEPLLKTRTILLTGTINARSARAVCERLLYLDRIGSQPIDLYIRTDGGWTRDGHMICAVIQSLGAKVNTYAAGSCQSAGLKVLAAGTGVRTALPGTVLMLHVNEREGDEELSADRVQREQDERFWRAHAKLPADWFPMAADSVRYLHAEDALKYGLIDVVAPPKKR